MYNTQFSKNFFQKQNKENQKNTFFIMTIFDYRFSNKGRD